MFNCCCLNGVNGRNIIREGYGIQGDCCMDSLTALCCGPCSSTQLLIETKKRGALTVKQFGDGTQASVASTLAFPTTD